MRRSLAALALLLAGSGLAAAQTANMYLDPTQIDDASLAPGSVFTVAVKCDVDNPLGLIAADLAIEYDPTILQAVGGIPGDFWDQPFVVNNADSAPGHYWFVALSLGNWVYTGTYTIVTVTFRVLSVGTTDLRLIAGDDMGGAQYPPIYLDGMNEVVFADPVGHGRFSNVAPLTSGGGDGGGSSGGGCAVQSATDRPSALLVLAILLALLLIARRTSAAWARSGSCGC